MRAIDTLLYQRGLTPTALALAVLVALLLVVAVQIWLMTPTGSAAAPDQQLLAPFRWRTANDLA